MPASGQNYIIAGAGITGMTLALALAKFGAAVTVLERHSHIQEFGAGLQISPNARHVLDELGLDAALGAVSHEPDALDTYPQGSLEPLVSLQLGTLMRERFGAPYAVMHRADLANVLYKACRRFANIDILFGVKDWKVASHAQGVTVTMEEAGGQSRTTRARAFIGADGVHSHTREAVLGGPKARFGNRIAWRTLVDLDAAAALIAPTRVSVFFGGGFHLVCYPLPHRRQVNLALFMPGAAPEAVKTQPRPDRPGPRVAELLRLAGSGWAPWPLFTVDAPDWTAGNVGIIGDAAHAMVPFQAQGAAMGIEDAAVLAPLLVGAGSAAVGLRRYADTRQNRVGRVAALSARNGRIFHMKWPTSLARDAVMRLQGPHGHLGRLGWIYGYKTNALPANEKSR